MTPFEDELWDRLVEDHDADHASLIAPHAARRPRPLMIGGGLTAVAVATAATVLAVDATTGTPPAYAMTQNPNGSVTFSINDLATAIPQLNAEFAKLGIQETVVPVTENCSNPTPLSLDTKISSSYTETLYPGRKWLAPGYTGVLAAETLSGGHVAFFMGAVQPPVPSCFSATKALTVGPDANGTPSLTETTVTPAGATSSAGPASTTTTGAGGRWGSGAPTSTEPASAEPATTSPTLTSAS